MLLRSLVLPLNLTYKQLNNPADALQWGCRDPGVLSHIEGLDHLIFPLFTERGDLPIVEGERELRVLSRWCAEQFGRRGRTRAWNHVAGVFAFRDSANAFAFKMRWAGVTPE